ncbi:MAG: pullulanase-type alpha-1,6-glucosidase [Actinomycetota bacterium]|nr:pullulanase-type alpha-1,6-glucosidase [Actinomycetota bacterium]
MKSRRTFSMLVSVALVASALTIAVVPAVADHTPDPASVTIAGSLQDELGCSGEWQPDCADTHIGYDTDDDVWQGTFTVPAGSFEYKAALNDSWDESYGSGGGNIALTTAAETDVKFYYDHKSHWITDNVNSVVATAVGDFQSELACPGNWQPECLRSWMQDADGDGIYEFATDQIPAGGYEGKVALDEAWAISHPAANIPFTVADGEIVTFTYDTATDDVNVAVDPPPPPGPASVTIVGSLQDELGCPGDWQPECASTYLGYDTDDDVWQGTFAIPAGTWEYKAALNDSWDENYGAGAVLDGPNIVLTLAADTDVKFYYDHKTHWVTDDLNSVVATAVGDFQSELACPGNWQPECLRSWMQDADGDGIYEFATDQIPAGGYEGKVALDEAWDISFPGSNVAFAVPADGNLVTFTYDTTTNDVTIDVETGGLEPGDADLVRAPARTPAADDTMYFVMPDRFINGDPGNDAGGDLSGDPLVNGLLPTDKGYFHGGDIAGLEANLDYLASLGITAIWMTPQFTNNAVQGDGTIGGSTSGYHGYWQIDYNEIDPHFGSNTEMQDLIDAAHALGIKVFFDIVANHTGDVVTYEEGVFTYRNKDDYPYADADGVEFDDRDYAGTGAFPDLDPATSFPYTPAFIDAGDDTAKAPAWLNDPIYYHNRGNSTFTGENSLYGDFFGLDDLFTEHPVVQDGLIDIFKGMITDFDIDGFRLDTVKHVNDEFWEAFVPAIESHADTLGKPDFSVFGEVFSSDPAFASRYTTELSLPALLDFGFAESSRNFAASSAATDELRDRFADDDYFTDEDSNASFMPKFTGNHDTGRIGYYIDIANPGADDSERLARTTLDHALMYFTRGYPVVYYGDEQGFVGDGGDKDARQDVMPSLVPSYNDDDLIGTSSTTADENLDEAHPLYQSLADFAGLRAAHVALRQGAQIHRYSEGSAGIYAFSRIERGEQVEYVVALNNSEAPDSATFGTDTPNATWTELYPGGGASLASDATGSLSVDVPALGFVVYRADTTIALPAAAPAIAITAPASGDEVTGRVRVAADVGGGNYAEVTFAVSIDGAAFEPFATDDNAPYGAFYDVSDLAAATSVVFKAIVADAAVNLNADKVTVTVGDQTVPGDDGARYAIVHYFRDDGDYGDHTTGDYNDYWGLHLWGDIDETIEWTAPKPFLGEDEYGRFAWIELAPDATDVGFIVHRGDVKDGTLDDRSFDPSVMPEIWLRQDDATTYTNQADAQGYVTIRYHRDDGDYGDPASPDYNDYWGVHLWGDAIDPTEGTEWTAPKPPTGIDDYGAYWNIVTADPSQPVNFIIHRGDSKDPGPDQSFVPVENATVWIQSGDETIYPQRGAAEGMATLHYHRPDGDYGDPTSDDYNDFWGLHTWGGADDPGWTTPRKPVDFDVFGAVFDVPLFEDASNIGYLLHRGGEKDPGPDQSLSFDEWGYEVWQLQGADPEAPYVLPITSGDPISKGNLSEQQAHWVSEDTIVWAAATDSGATYRLHWSPGGGLSLSDDGVSGGDSVAVTVSGTYTEPGDVEGFRHLEGLPTLQIDSADLATIPAILQGQIAVAATSGAGIRIDATGLQIPGVLDDLYGFDGDLGVVWDGSTPTLRLWAPTAQDVNLILFDDADPATTGTSQEMVRDIASGTWSVTGDASWDRRYYLYEVEVYAPSTGQVEMNLVTDPYSLSLSMNSARTQIVDLTDEALAPNGWDAVDKPPLAQPEDIAIYELHVRDFSANDPTVPDEMKGTFKAFTLNDSQGMSHLAGLADAGLSHVHLLPTFDIATINEDKAEWQAPDHSVLATYPPDSEEQQAQVTLTEDLDGFNWGYDPLHYTTPEGSYSTDPDGPTRVVEFREMVQSLNEAGLRVVQDVVYNHTNASGQAEKSVLDRIVPGYYHRLDDKGAVTTSTCCANTATEHQMMQKLMVDSVVTWARAYKVDGFRFDLMGHHSKQNMLDVRSALDALTVAADGVDGSAIYLYGEGWNFGEVADDVRFDQATQLNMRGTGIGTFSDRLRDAVRGGGPFDSGDALLLNQGFINGTWYDPNEAVVAAGVPEQDQLDELLLSGDQIRVGLAGNLADYVFVDRNGDTVAGSEVDYNGSPAGYTGDPQENIVYVAAHDNQTLFDINQFHNPVATSMTDRVRVQNLGIDFTVLAQGVPFLHAGIDMLRSKSLDRDSYNSGDWFNRLDFDYRDNTWGAGLPVAGKNADNWPFMQPLLADPSLKPEPEHIAVAVTHAQEMLEVRSSSPLFRLTTEAEVMERVEFHNTGPSQIPGLIVMSITDTVGEDLDPRVEDIVTLFNASDEEQTFTLSELAGRFFSPHPVLANSADAVVQTAAYDKATGTFTIPARTTAVFVDDAIPPEVGAGTEPQRGGPEVAWFTVHFSCTDADPDTTTVADINGVPVEDGQDVRLIHHPSRTDHVQKKHRLDIYGQEFLLTVTCTDSSGNSTTVEVIPGFPQGGEMP